MNAPPRRNGFTLMEVIVTVVVLGTGIVLLAQGVTAAIRSNARVQRLTRAAAVADEIFHRMEIGEIDYASQSEGNLEDTGPDPGFSGAGEEEEAYRSVYRWYAAAQTWGDDTLYRVDLTVSWDETGPDSYRSFTFSRLFHLPPETEDEGTGTQGAGAGAQGPGGGG